MEKYEEKKGSEIKKYHQTDSEDNFKKAGTTEYYITGTKIFLKKKNSEKYTYVLTNPLNLD
jgi:hypothetical protein